MFQSKPMSSVEKQLRTKKIIARNKKVRVVVYKFYATAAITLFTLILVCGVVLEVNSIIGHDVLLNTATAQIGGKNEVSVEDYIFSEVEKALGRHEAIKAMGIIKCESNFRTDIVTLEPNGSASLGIWQINTIHNKVTSPNYISNADKLDYKKATAWAIKKRISDTNWHAWTCGR